MPLIENGDNNISDTIDYIENNEDVDLILICGSFFIMTDVRNHFGIPESTILMPNLEND